MKSTPTEKRSVRKVRDGKVVSNKMDKTVVVAITRRIRHTAYGKFVRKTRKYYAHDKDNSCAIGDQVRIVEMRPMSKLKRWRVQSIITKAVE
jgi:small subunit ribosomal protein S17